MSDRTTGTVWTHLDGTALQGELVGERLQIYPIVHTTWGTWSELHPDTTVLDNHTPFRHQYRPVVLGGASFGPMFAQTLLYEDDRLPGNEIVVGVTSDGESRAYVLDDMPSGLGAVNDELAGRPIVVFHWSEEIFGLAFSRNIAGRTLTFIESAGAIVDLETESTWTMEGLAIDGPLIGERLSFVTSFITEWYGWSAFHPSTEIA